MIDIIIGSESDLEQLRMGLDSLKEYRVHVISCHRNPEELRKYAEEIDDRVIIAAAGKAAALPGVLCAWLRHYRKINPVFGVALAGNSCDSRAAVLSIENLPNNPLVLDDGKAFFGSLGFHKACKIAVSGKFEVPIFIHKKSHFDLEVKHG